MFVFFFLRSIPYNIRFIGLFVTIKECFFIDNINSYYVLFTKLITDNVINIRHTNDRIKRVSYFSSQNQLVSKKIRMVLLNLINQN